MNKTDTKRVATTVARMNAQKRRLKRRETKEINKINGAMNKLQNEFSAFIFGFDWDNITHLEYNDGTEVPINELKPFKDFNAKWVRWCELWRKDKHNTPVNDNAFHDWAINNTKTNKDDRIIDFVDIKQSIVYGDFFRISI